MDIKTRRLREAADTKNNTMARMAVAAAIAAIFISAVLISGCGKLPELDKLADLEFIEETEPEILQGTPEGSILSWNGEDVIPAYSGTPWAEVHGNSPYFSEGARDPDVFESYSDLDDLGRCGQAYANICETLMPMEERGQIGQVKPSGWHTVKYPEQISDLYLYNRCHLIGFQLAGENANEKNLVTGTRYLNIEGMLPFENEIADHVHETKHHVLYRVTPVFLDDDLVCRGVEMEAMCIEDNGKTNGSGVCFHVFAYNVQPGIGINYATGESWVEDNGKESGETDPAGIQDDERGTGKQEYAININTGKFHLLDCASVQKANPENIKFWTCARDELIEDGYSPCGVCKP